MRRPRPTRAVDTYGRGLEDNGIWLYLSRYQFTAYMYPFIWWSICHYYLVIEIGREILFCHVVANA
jgi:hypothetical protein